MSWAMESRIRVRPDLHSRGAAGAASAAIQALLFSMSASASPDRLRASRASQNSSAIIISIDGIAITG